MSAEATTKHYKEVAQLDSFWEAVFNFITLKEAEGEKVATALMTDCVQTGALREKGIELECAPRTTLLQEKAFESFRAFLTDPALTPEAASVCLEALRETAGV